MDGGGKLSHGKGKGGKEKGAIELEPVKKKKLVLNFPATSPLHFCRLCALTQGANDCGKKGQNRKGLTVHPFKELHYIVGEPELISSPRHQEIDR